MKRHRVQLRGFRSGASRRGFTLIELATTLAISTVLLVSLGSAIMIASHAMPDRNDPTRAALLAGTTVEAIADELRFARSFSERGADRVEFSVPDRSGDEVDEIIRYEWSSVAGEPLRRRINGGEWTSLVAAVSGFELSYDYRVETVTTDVVNEATTPETLLASFDGWPALTPTVTNTAVGTSNWAAEIFRVNAASIPVDAVNVTITRVSLFGKRSATTGDLTVGVHQATTGATAVPQANPLGSAATTPLSALPASNAWFDVVMPSGVLTDQLNKDLVIVVRGSVSSAGTVQMYTHTSAPTDSNVALWSTNAGSNWNPSSSRFKNDHRFSVHGTFTIRTIAHVTTSTTHLRSVRVSLTPSGSGGLRCVLGAEVYAQPQVVMP